MPRFYGSKTPWNWRKSSVPRFTCKKRRLATILNFLRRRAIYRWTMPATCRRLSLAVRTRTGRRHRRGHRRTWVAVMMDSRATHPRDIREVELIGRERDAIQPQYIEAGR